MSNPTGFDVDFSRLTFSPTQQTCDDQKDSDPPHHNYPRTFQLFGNSTSPNNNQRHRSSSSSPFEVKPPPTSPLPEGHFYSSSSILDVGAPAFVPKPTVASPVTLSRPLHHEFDPFNPDTPTSFDHSTNDDDMGELSGHLLSTQLLDDFDTDDDAQSHSSPPPQCSSTTATPTTLSTTFPTTPDNKTLDIPTAGNNHTLWSSSLSTHGSNNKSTPGWSSHHQSYLLTNGASATVKSPSTSTAMKHIWENTSSTNPWDRAEHERQSSSSCYSYGEMDEKEFDPTLQYYCGSLIDNDTIQDMSRLSLSVTNPSLEEKQAENVGEDMSALQMLESIFTDLSEDELTATLEEHGYDMDKATEALFNRKQKQHEQQLPLSSPAFDQQSPASLSLDATPKKRQVCRHFLAGECYRKDCWFAHDLQVKVCKFWLQGSCLKGEFCEFSHHIDVHEVANKISSSQQQQKKQQQQHQPHTSSVQFDESEYPGLGGRGNKPKKPTDTGFIHQKQQEPLQIDQEDFPALGAPVNTKRIVKPSAKAVINFAEVAKRKPIHNGKANKTKGTTTKRILDPGLMKRLRQPVNIPWLVNGDPLNKEYLQQREQAIQYGLLRNRFFSRATAYYLEGDGAKAKAYSNQAKHYNRLMQEMHNEASLRIFEKRNQHEAFIDLHGLHVDEALDIVQDRLENLSSSYEGIVYIVTGTGHHSGASGLSSKRSKIKPSVEEFLRQGNYRFAETSIVGDNKGGIFAVDIKCGR